MVNNKRARGRPPHGLRNKVSITMRISPDLLSRVRKAAQECNIPYQSIIHKAVEEKLAFEARTKSQQDCTQEKAHITEDLFMSLSKDPGLVISSLKGKNGDIVLGAGSSTRVRAIFLAQVICGQVKSKFQDTNNEEKLKKRNNQAELQQIKQSSKSIRSLHRKSIKITNDLLLYSDIRAKNMDEVQKILNRTLELELEAEENFKIINISQGASFDLVKLVSDEMKKVDLKLVNLEKHLAEWIEVLCEKETKRSNKKWISLTSEERDYLEELLRESIKKVRRERRN